jgi:hypothetical protein
MTYLAASRLRRGLHTAPWTLKRFTVPCRLNDVGLSQHLAQPQALARKLGDAPSP